MYKCEPRPQRRMICRKRGVWVKWAYDLRRAVHGACPECGGLTIRARQYALVSALNFLTVASRKYTHLRFLTVAAR